MPRAVAEEGRSLAVNVSLTQKLIDEIDEAAEKIGKSRSWTIRRLCTYALETHGYIDE